MEEYSSDGEEEQGGSSDEDIVTGTFFNKIEKERNRARHERRYLMTVLKSKSRVGSIFFDKVKRVVAAIQREKGIYDYLIEWEFSDEDKMKPTTSIVQGSHFVFAKPLLFRRYIEENYIEVKHGEVKSSQPVVCYSPEKH